MKRYLSSWQLLSIFIMTLLVMSLAACSEEEIPDQTGTLEQQARTSHQAIMLLQAALPQFDATASSTRAAESWNDGDKLIVQFKSGNTWIDGQAIYQAATSTWNVYYNNTLPETDDGTCQLYFFENAGAYTFSSVPLTEQSVIYRDGEATYTFDGSVVSVTANLTPMTGRIRLKSNAGKEYRLSGFRYYTNYDFTTNSFTSADLYAFSTTDASGYSPYYYGFFPNENQRDIILDDTEGNNVSYVRTLGSNALAAGRSGYLDIPTAQQRNGWRLLPAYKDITVGGFTFRMIRVVAGTFTMGEGELSDETLHSVTLSKSYYLAETEMTQGIYKAIVGTYPSGVSEKDNDYPIYNVSWKDAQEFLEKLSAKTGVAFRLPTEAEWEYATRGGCLSHDYTFSGSNVLEDVAVPSSQGGTLQKVNELGFYDMSGNVWEWCQDTYAAYTSDEVTDPTGAANGVEKVVRGGSYFSSSSGGFRDMFFGYEYWSDYAWRVSYWQAVYSRRSGDSSGKYYNLGFRIATQ